MINLALKLLKIISSGFWENDTCKEIINELADDGISKLEELCKNKDILSKLSFENEEIENQSIISTKTENIRVNIVEFIRHVNIEDVAKKCRYNEAELGKILADEYCKFYEQDTEDEFKLYQRAFRSLANEVIKIIKNSADFEKNRIFDCYNVLAKYQEEYMNFEQWKLEISTLLNNILGVISERTINPFQNIVDNLPVKKSSSSAFHYLYENIDIYGRDEELKLLDNFINAPEKFLFWAILGPGGIGKSKLAYSFMQKHINDIEWKIAFLPSQKLREILLLTEWEYPCNLLLVIDYAGSVADELGKWIEMLALSSTFRNKKIRLLLLERQGYRKVESIYTYEEKYVAPEWYNRLSGPHSEGIFTDKETIKQYQYLPLYYPCMLTLKSLQYESYRNIMDSYANAIDKENLSEKRKREIMDYVSFTSHNLNNNIFQVTPLYILFVTDAALNGKSFRNWDLEKLMQYVYVRDRIIWEKRICEKKLLHALLDILIFTTVVKEWEFGKYNIEKLENLETVINEYRVREVVDPIYDWIHILTGKLCDDNTLPIMYSLEPDLVGEYFVLKRLETFDYKKIKQWSSIFLDDTFACREFFERCIQDYGKVFGATLVEILLKMSEELNEKKSNDMLKEQVKTVSFLWLQYYEKVLPLYTIESKNGIRQFCEKWKFYSQDAAELYTIVFCEKVSIKGRQKKKIFIELEKLYNQWSNSVIISRVYLELLASLVEYSYGSGYILKGERYIILIQQIIDKWGTTNEEVALSCASALEKIIPIQYEAGSKEQVKNQVKVLSDLINNLNSESFVLYFITVQGDIAITQGLLREENECKKTIIILNEAIKKWGTRNDRIAWRTIDVITNVFKRIGEKSGEDIKHKIIKMSCDLANGCSELSSGIIWHAIKALDRIASVDFITFEEIEYISTVQEKCYQRLKWW